MFHMKHKKMRGKTPHLNKYQILELTNENYHQHKQTINNNSLILLVQQYALCVHVVTMRTMKVFKPSVESATSVALVSVKHF